VGSGWKVVGRLLQLVPRVVRDAGYDAVARIRYQLFPRPTDACPVTPPELRARFED